MTYLVIFYGLRASLVLLSFVLLYRVAFKWVADDSVYAVHPLLARTGSLWWRIVWGLAASGMFLISSARTVWIHPNVVIPVAVPAYLESSALTLMTVAGLLLTNWSMAMAEAGFLINRGTMPRWGVWPALTIPLWFVVVAFWAVR